MASSTCSEVVHMHTLKHIRLTPPLLHHIIKPISRLNGGSDQYIAGVEVSEASVPAARDTRANGATSLHPVTVKVTGPERDAHCPYHRSAKPLTVATGDQRVG